MKYKCKICGFGDGNLIKVREMMFGTREVFDYYECNNCGVAQITEIPQNIGKYYPNDFYSFDPGRQKRVNSMERKLRRLKLLFYIKLHFFSNLGLKLFFKKLYFYEWVKYTGIKKNSKILDIGSGNGELLNDLYINGYEDLTGIDPYIKGDIKISSQINIYKKSIFEMTENVKYDLIIINHVLEHIENPNEFLKKVKELLKPDGNIIIKIPFKDSFAYEKYKENWVQFDAPRHFFLYTHKSLEILMKNAGLLIENITFNSTIFQFTGSEKYIKDIPLTVERENIFSEAEIDKFKNLTKKLNAEKNGDEITIYLKKSDRAIFTQ